MKNRQTNSQGLVTLIFILVIALIASLVLMIGQSRLFLALQRSVSTSDNILTLYKAESEVNDLLYRYANGKISLDQLLANSNTTFEGLELIKKGAADKKSVTITTKRPYAVSALQISINSGTPATETTTLEPTDIILALDCSGSMGDDSGGESKTTKMWYMRQAVLSFLNKIKNHPESSKLRVGILLFQTKTAWMREDGDKGTSLGPGFDISRYIKAVEKGFNSDKEDSSRENSKACDVTGEGATNLGGALYNADKWLTTNSTAAKKVAILVTDGIPTARWEKNDSCKPIKNSTCELKDCTKWEPERWLQCNLAPTTESGIDASANLPYTGLRDPSIEHHAVGILLPGGRTKTLFNHYLPGRFYNGSPSKINNFLSNIFTRVTVPGTDTTFFIEEVVPEE